jgi:hypothetical protein
MVSFRSSDMGSKRASRRGRSLRPTDYLSFRLSPVLIGKDYYPFIHPDFIIDTNLHILDPNPPYFLTQRKLHLPLHGFAEKRWRGLRQVYSSAHL